MVCLISQYGVKTFQVIDDTPLAASCFNSRLPRFHPFVVFTRINIVTP